MTQAKNSKKQKKIIIEGVTTEGKRFRPSDWAERMSGPLTTYKNKRMRYSPLLQPGLNGKGDKCLILDPTLKSSNPALYQSIMDFAQINHLKISQEED